MAEPIRGKSSAPRAVPPADIVTVQPVTDVSRFLADGDAAWIPFGKATAVGRRKDCGPGVCGLSASDVELIVRTTTIVLSILRRRWAEEKILPGSR